MNETTSQSNSIEFRHVSFSYNGTNILHEADLSIGQREFACIVGPNGGGKTTLIKLALGLLKPSSGRVILLGDSPATARRHVGYMPQSAHVDPRFPVPVIDVVLMGRLGGRIMGPYSRADKETAVRVLAEVGLASLEDRSYATLSGGEQRRVFIARALACEPELLILDEPTANLDPEAESELYDLLSGFNERMAVVVVSHDMTFVSQFVQRVICVKRGVHIHPTSAIADGSIAEVFRSGMRIVRHDQHTGSDAHE